MSLITTIAVVLALLGSTLIGGVFFAFSSFIMKALARVPAPAGIAVMQSINVVVVNRWFLGAFIGTAAVALLVGVLAILGWGAVSSPWLLAGAVLYLAGTFLVTTLGNVPLNNRLAGVASDDPGAAALWAHYLDRWTLWNSVRAAAAMAAAAAFTAGLMQMFNA